MNNNPINTKLIISYLKDNNLSIRKFCKLCQISSSTYGRIMGKGNCRINAVFKIARVLNIRACQMFDK